MEMACSEENENENYNYNMWRSKRSRDDDEMKQLPGYRFHPTDEELVSFYLRNKVENKPPFNLIKQLDIYSYDPWDLTKIESSNVGEKEWFFFCMRARKYRNSVRPNRVTASGFWKATGIDRPINAGKQPHKCVGLKKSLVYYRGHAGKGTKTDWMMHEFRLPPAPKTTSPNHLVTTTLDIAQEAEVWTLCRIFKRVPSYKKYTPSDSNLLQNPAAAVAAAATTTIEEKSPMTMVDSSSSSSLDSECTDRIGDVVDDQRNSCSHYQTNSTFILEPPNFWNLNAAGGSVVEEDLLASYLYLCNN